MSERARPVDFPEEIDRAIEVLGNRVKVAALLALLSRDRATATELAEQLQVGRALVRHHLQDLERLGVVTVQPQQPETRRRYFQIDRDALRAAVGVLSPLAEFATAPSEDVESGKK